MKITAVCQATEARGKAVFVRFEVSRDDKGNPIDPGLASPVSAAFHLVLTPEAASQFTTLGQYTITIEKI